MNQVRRPAPRRSGAAAGDRPCSGELRLTIGSSPCACEARRNCSDRAAAVQHNARTLSGPPSTRATVAMDGGVADTARANTKNSCEHKPLIGKSWGKGERRNSICASPMPPFPRMYSRGTNRTAVRGSHSCRTRERRGGVSPASRIRTRRSYPIRGGGACSLRASTPLRMSRAAVRIRSTISCTAWLAPATSRRKAMSQNERPCPIRRVFALLSTKTPQGTLQWTKTKSKT